MSSFHFKATLIESDHNKAVYHYYPYMVHGLDQFKYTMRLTIPLLENGEVDRHTIVGQDLEIPDELPAGVHDTMINKCTRVMTGKAVVHYLKNNSFAEELWYIA